MTLTAATKPVLRPVKYTDLQIVRQFGVANDNSKQGDINAAYGRELDELTVASWCSQG